ncbi:hypothetical protein L218DRAFT_1075552 [Marasmius fiardii PR-910]|nr:hypothetical protein L218DRAFT_1075552 [Marasmius fiardii PR-910]
MFSATAFARSFVSARNVDSVSPTPTRTEYDLIWSCITTIFACTWLAIHPNIPSPKDSYWKVTSRRMMIMLLGILVPEYTTVWALRQWLAARYVKQRMASVPGIPEWTTTHSFFLVMGGFVLEDDQGKPISSLRLQEILQLNHEGKIDFPTISEQEIQDRSKGDALSKTLILFQTTWFLLQVLARSRMRLPLTELEVVTIAFASLNVLTYGFWYNKPLNVNCAVRVRLLCRLRTQGSCFTLSMSGTSLHDGVSLDDIETADITDVSPHNELQCDTDMENQTRRPLGDVLPVTTLPTDPEKGSALLTSPIIPPENNHSSLCLEQRTTRIMKRLYFSFFFVASIVHTTVRSLHRAHRHVRILPEVLNPGITQRGHPSHEDETYYDTTRVNDTVFVGEFRDDGSLRVPTFYCGLPQTDLGRTISTIPGIAQVVIAIYFGGVHCIAWKFTFPSTEEQWLWRQSALILILIPSYFLLAQSIIKGIFRRKKVDGLVGKLFRPISFILGLIGLAVLRRPRVFGAMSRLAMYIYLTFRCILVVLPFILLRKLPQGALEEVEWTKFIPHF